MRLVLCLLVCAASGCTTAGSTWMAQPLPGSEREEPETLLDEPVPPARPAPPRRRLSRVIGESEPALEYGPDFPVQSGIERAPEPSKLQGRVLGTFRNTYYDFPSEQDFQGESVALKNSKCATIKQVPRAFYEAVCVQGSGTLASGATVSFARRDCECADVCPRTGQRICFDALDAAQFPWGRGATGQPITPLLTVAVDTSVIPMNTPVYVPEFDGMPRDPSGRSSHDGCFLAQDRGIRIKGKHLDVFTGHTSITKLWNQLVPSNRGVTVVLDSPRCARASLGTPEAAVPPQPAAPK